jgi:hypothetical protein
MTLPPIRRRLAAPIGIAIAAALTLSACGGGSDDGPDAGSAIEPAAGAQRLSGVCPDEVTVQLQWQPQSDMGALFHLLGPGYTVDTAAKSVTGPLVVDGRDTGVDLSLRAGGGAIGFQTVASQMYLDDSVELGLVHGDQLVSAAGTQRVVGVTPLLKYSPAILMWDPETHPDWDSVRDIHRSGATVVVSREQIFPDWLVAQGLLDRSQIDGSYDGAPARFVSDPSIAQQGFANSEPYTYAHDTPAWNRPVDYQLLRDVGYDVYASNVTVRADRLDALAPCLTRLVPIIQQAGVDYVTHPDEANAAIVDVVGQDTSYIPYSAEEAAYSAELLREEGLIANEDDGSLGTYDEARVGRTIDELVGVLNDGGAGLPPGLTAADLVTNRFVDPSIGIP